MFLGIVGWFICGFLIGLMASKAINLRGDDPRLGIGVASLGAIAGGFLFSLVSGSTISWFNVWSLVFASIAALVAAGVWHYLRTRGTYVRPSTRRSY